MNINEITDMYYNAVVNLEKYLKTQKENIDELHFESNDNKKQLYKVIHYWWYDTFCNSLKPYMSWKSSEKMNYDQLKEVFTKGDLEQINHYLIIRDVLDDFLSESAGNSLTTYYEKNGQDIDDDSVIREIIEESSSLITKEKIDSKIYPEEIVELHSIAHQFYNACNYLEDYYKQNMNKKDIEM